MLKRPLSVLLTAVLVFLLPSGLLAQQTGTIVGTVTDASSGQPLAGAQIAVEATATGGLNHQPKSSRRRSMGFRCVKEVVPSMTE